MASVKFTLNISISAAPLSVVSDPLNVTGSVGTPLSASLASNVQGGVAPYNFGVNSGSLPPGLTLDAQGNLSGTPASPGTFTAEISVSDSGA